MTEYYAKSKNGQYTETLFCHLSRTLEHAEEIIEKHDIYDKSIINAIKIAAAFHDIGKADKRFQKYLLYGNPKVYHPLLAMPVVFEITKCLDNNLQSLVLFSIASHHTSLHQELYSDVSDIYLEVDDQEYFEKGVYTLSKRIGLDSVDTSQIYVISCKSALNKARELYRPP
ncbi:MAG: CRISPR-associated endonuclease Cas3'' [Candidatus Nitrosocosmicus sp.]|nr:CRISPR-associated endonuclease Cas3'' [Candidatus Nitrosocosmicus sp.]